MKVAAEKSKVDKASANRGQIDLKTRPMTGQKEGRKVSIRLDNPGNNLHKINKIANKFRQRYERLIKEGYFADLQSEFDEAMCDENESLELKVALDIGISDVARSGETMPLKQFVINYSHYDPSELIRDRLFIRKYLVRDRIELASNESCPNCWSRWESKVIEPSCPTCRMEIGKDIKFLLETDHCPFCNQKGILESGLECSNCDNTIEQKMIAWACE